MRTARDFVKESIQRGRSKNMILAVASATRWGRHYDEVIEVLSSDEVEKWAEEGKAIRLDRRLLKRMRHRDPKKAVKILRKVRIRPKPKLKIRLAGKNK